MNKPELITRVAERTGLTKKDTEKTMNVMLDILCEVLEVSEARTPVFKPAKSFKERVEKCV